MSQNDTNQNLAITTKLPSARDNLLTELHDPSVKSAQFKSVYRALSESEDQVKSTRSEITAVEPTKSEMEAFTTMALNPVTNTGN